MSVNGTLSPFPLVRALPIVAGTAILRGENVEIHDACWELPEPLPSPPPPLLPPPAIPHSLSNETDREFWHFSERYVDDTYFEAPCYLALRHNSMKEEAMRESDDVLLDSLPDTYLVFNNKAYSLDFSAEQERNVHEEDEDGDGDDDSAGLAAAVGQGVGHTTVTSLTYDDKKSSVAKLGRKEGAGIRGRRLIEARSDRGIMSDFKELKESRPRGARGG